MKIYYETDLYDECINACPFGKGCMVGSMECKFNCKHFIREKSGYDSNISIFYVKNKASMRNAQYIECVADEEITFWKMIKRYIYKLFN